MNGDASQVGNTYKLDGGNGAASLLTAGTSWIDGGSFAFAKVSCPTSAIGRRAVQLAAKPVVAIMGDSLAEGFADVNNGEVG